jgi:hypothetical protein
MKIGSNFGWTWVNWTRNIFPNIFRISFKVLKIKNKAKMMYKNATMGVNRHNDGEQVINSWLSRNCMEKMRTFSEIDYRYVHKYCI